MVNPIVRYATRSGTLNIPVMAVMSTRPKRLSGAIPKLGLLAKIYPIVLPAIKLERLMNPISRYSITPTHERGHGPGFNSMIGLVTVVSVWKIAGGLDA
jgi:hypothetical protein